MPLRSDLLRSLIGMLPPQEIPRELLEAEKKMRSRQDREDAAEQAAFEEAMKRKARLEQASEASTISEALRRQQEVEALDEPSPDRQDALIRVIAARLSREREEREGLPSEAQVRVEGDRLGRERREQEGIPEPRRLFDDVPGVRMDEIEDQGRQEQPAFTKEVAEEYVRGVGERIDREQAEALSREARAGGGPELGSRAAAEAPTQELGLADLLGEIRRAFPRRELSIGETLALLGTALSPRSSPQDVLGLHRSLTEPQIGGIEQMAVSGLIGSKIKGMEAKEQMASRRQLMQESKEVQKELIGERSRLQREFDQIKAGRELPIQRAKQITAEIDALEKRANLMERLIRTEALRPAGDPKLEKELREILFGSGKTPGILDEINALRGMRALVGQLGVEQPVVAPGVLEEQPQEFE